MQLFVRDSAGRTTAYTAASPLELQEQVFASLSEASSHARLSYRSRTLPNLQHVATNSTDNSSSSSFADYAIGPYATIDLSFRLRGGGPKKRCAHVSVKTSSSSSNTPSTSGTATPSSSSGIVSKPTVATTAPSSAANPAVGADSNKKDVNSEGNKAMQVDESEKKEDGTTVTITPAPSASEASTTDSAADATTTTTVGPTSVVPLNSEPILERCSNAALRMVGECNQCNKNFCGNHRLPEDHACPALQNFRKAAFDENMKRLNKEATFTSKISAF